MIPEQTVKDKNGSVPYPRGAIFNTAIGMGRLKCRVELMNGISTNILGQIDSYQKIESLGSVFIGDNVEIGACVTIDSGSVQNTIIGDGTKIDNLVHIAHNVKIGKNCLICGQVGIAGSTSIGDRVVMDGQVGVGDNLTIG